LFFRSKNSVVIHIEAHHFSLATSTFVSKSKRMLLAASAAILMQQQLKGTLPGICLRRRCEHCSKHTDATCDRNVWQCCCCCRPEALRPLARSRAVAWPRVWERFGWAAAIRANAASGFCASRHTFSVCVCEKTRVWSDDGQRP